MPSNGKWDLTWRLEG